jgi:putative hemolysin
MLKNSRTLIDLEGILKTRAPKYYKWLPGFIIRFLKKIIHQEDINEIITTYSDHEGHEFISDIIRHLNVKVSFSGIENLEKDKKYVFAANHPLGGLDGLATMQVINNIISDVTAIINDLLLNIEGLRPVLQGVNVFKRNTKEHIKQIDDLYIGEKQILVFPAGMVSRKIKGVVKDMEWKKSFLSKAIQHKRDIIPVYVDGKNSNLFYTFAKLRKFFGFKFNFELIFLPKEFFGYKNKTIRITFGKPISFYKFDESKSIDEWVLYVRNETYKLA